MKPMRRRELVSTLERDCFVYEGENKHPIYKCIITNIRIPIPNGRDISPGTLRDIYKAYKRIKQERIKRG